MRFKKLFGDSPIGRGRGSNLKTAFGSSPLARASFPSFMGPRLTLAAGDDPFALHRVVLLVFVYLFYDHLRQKSRNNHDLDFAVRTPVIPVCLPANSLGSIWHEFLLKRLLGKKAGEVPGLLAVGRNRLAPFRFCDRAWLLWHCRRVSEDSSRILKDLRIRDG